MLLPILHIRRRAVGLTACNFGSFRGWVRHLIAQVQLVSGYLDAFVAIDPLRVERLVFVCLGNINRSPFAEAVARASGVRTCSIGLSTTTGAYAFPTAVVTGRRFGIDLSEHRATNFNDYQFTAGDLLLAMEVRHVNQLRTAGIPAGNIALLGAWSTPRRVHIHDPHPLGGIYFYSCFTLIQSGVINLAAELRAGNSASVIG